MFQMIDVTYIDDDDGLENDEYPCEVAGKCPLCHVALRPQVLSAFLYNDKIYAIDSCPACDGVFFVTYAEKKDQYCIDRIMPQKFESTDIPASIKEMSPSFSNIFAQAQRAEENGLSEICGLGYRRALEFLVKDYLCHSDPDHADEIKRQPLGPCISSRIRDQRIKILAERATWIGNDETHYIRKHESLDVQDMKRFIHAMIPFIESEFAFEDALKIEPQK